LLHIELVRDCQNTFVGTLGQRVTEKEDPAFGGMGMQVEKPIEQVHLIVPFDKLLVGPDGRHFAPVGLPVNSIQIITCHVVAGQPVCDTVRVQHWNDYQCAFIEQPLFWFKKIKYDFCLEP
jgi:hypothetical protein